MKKRLSAIYIFLILSIAITGCDNGKKEPVTQAHIQNENTESSTAAEYNKDPDDTVNEDKKDDEKEEKEAFDEKTAKEAFEAFLKDETLAVSDIDKTSYFRAGNKYSFNEIVKKYIEEEDEYDEGLDLYDASYCYIDCGANDTTELAVWLDYGRDGSGGYDNLLCMFSYEDDEVHLFGTDTWGYRSQLFLNKYGHVANGGSGGANRYYCDYYYFNADNERVYLYMMEEEMGLAKPMIPKYYLKNGYERTDYPDTEYATSSREYTAYIYSLKEIDYSEDLSSEEMYEKYYKDYMFTFLDQSDQPAKPDIELAAFYKKEDVKWYDYNDLMSIMLDHVHKLGADDEILDADEVKWESLVDSKMITYPVKREDTEPEEDDTEVTYYKIMDDHDKPYLSPNAPSYDFEPIDLKLVSCEENEIIDVDKWFQKAGSSNCGNDFYDSAYRYVITGDAGYGTMTQINIYDKESGKWLYNFDLSDFLYEDGYDGKDYVDRGIHHCFITENFLYLNIYHTTYSADCPINAFMMCIDIENGEVLWISRPLVSNSNDFARYGDNLITGYGFTKEDDFIYILNRYTGEVSKKIKVKKSPDYFCFSQNDDLWVRTYSYDYVFNIVKEN